MQRIVLLGCAGAGKTALARKLGAQLRSPVICLDEVWQRGWGESDVPEFRARIRELHAGERWISDGNFAQATFDIRLPRADAIVWVDTPRRVAAWRALARVLHSDETHRLRDLGKVLAFVWRFERINRPRIETLRREFAPDTPVFHLRSSAEAENFAVSLK